MNVKYICFNQEFILNYDPIYIFLCRTNMTRFTYIKLICILAE